ncbi:MAG TPA: ABC transporter permease [Chthoniobacterales bacterium]|nr:ABC transporter permease [Chthoniobacterales bacterium]
MNQPPTAEPKPPSPDRLEELVSERTTWAGSVRSTAASMRAWIFLAFLLIGFEVWAQLAYHTTFLFNPFNAASIAVFTVGPLLLALGQTFVVISGGIDLSVGFTMGLAAVVFSKILNASAGALWDPLSLVIATAVALLASMVPGLINGLLIAKLRVPPFIGTLGMYGVARGIAYLLAGGTTVPISNPVVSFIGNGSFFFIPIVVLITIILTAAMMFLLSQSRFGRHVYAIGGNRQASLRAGINVSRNTIALYVLASVSAGIGGILYTARFTAGAPQAGETLLLDSIAAVVIGGASLFGGSGTITGTVIGALIIAVIQYGLVFVNVEPFWQFVAVGVVIIISVLVDQTQKQLTGARTDE